MGKHQVSPAGMECGCWQAANSATELNAGEWYHVAGVYDINVGAKIYINGVVDGSNDDTGGITHSDYPVTIAENSQALNRYWDGQIDEVMIYDVALSDDEVLALTVPSEDDGLIAAYSFEGDVMDASGNALDGTIMGDPIFVEGAVGQALDFDGDGDYVDCGASTLFDVTDAITVAVWVNIRSLPQAWSAVVGKGDSAWRISNNSSSMGMHFGFEDGSRGWQAANSATELNAGEWYHVAGVYDINVGAKIYINGVVDGSNDDTGGITHSDYPVTIAENSQALNRFWDGGIDEVMIYGRALSDDEVAALAGM